MNKAKYTIKVRKRAVQLVLEHPADHGSRRVAIASVSKEIGCTPETLRRWIRKSETEERGSVNISEFGRERSAKAEHGNKIKEEQLIFLISQPRSGSTLTQKLLGAHSQIYTRSEPWLMLHPAYSLKREGLYSEYDIELEKTAFNGFIEDLPNGNQTYIQEHCCPVKRS
jgi:transposase-like protein